MKKYLNLMLKTFIIGVSLSLGLIGGVFIYTSAFSTLSKVNTGDTLTAQMWNDVIDRVSNIFWNSGTSSLELNGSIKIGNSATCDTNTKGTMRFSGDRIEYCNTNGWNYFASTSLTIGTSDTPAISCLQIKQANSSSTSGLYWIQPSGQTKTQVYCDMSNDGGGWTLVAKIIGGGATHVNSSAVSTATDPNQGFAGKLSDSFINALKTSAGGFRLICNTTQVIFNYQCNFSAGTANSDSICHLGSDKGSRVGVSNRVGTPGIIYGYAGGQNGCRASSWSQNGTLRVK